MTDVTDADFEALVLERSADVPVIVDFWAPWCGPCRTLTPMIEAAVEATNGQVELANVNVDENPGMSASFGVQSIPAVFAVRDGRVVDRFVGAVPQENVDAFVARLIPVVTEVDRLIDIGDEASLRRALEIEPGNSKAVMALAELLVEQAQGEEALELLALIPNTPEVRHLVALARRGDEVNSGDVIDLLHGLLPQVKTDREAREHYLDLLEVMGADDPRSAAYRKALASALF